VWRNSTDILQTGQTPRPKVEDGKSSIKDGAPKRLGCKEVKKEMKNSVKRVCRL